jgi:hypothetical protein
MGQFSAENPCRPGQHPVEIQSNTPAIRSSSGESSTPHRRQERAQPSSAPSHDEALIWHEPRPLGGLPATPAICSSSRWR